MQKKFRANADYFTIVETQKKFDVTDVQGQNHSPALAHDFNAATRTYRSNGQKSDYLPPPYH